MKMEGNERLLKQMAFIREIDKEKSVFRQTWLSDGSRKENDAEHSWHLAMMALLLSRKSQRKGRCTPCDVDGFDS